MSVAVMDNDLAQSCQNPLLLARFCLNDRFLKLTSPEQLNVLNVRMHVFRLILLLFAEGVDKSKDACRLNVTRKGIVDLAFFDSYVFVRIA